MSKVENFLSYKCACQAFAVEQLDQFFEKLAAWIRNFECTFYTQIKISTLPGHTLDMC